MTTNDRRISIDHIDYIRSMINDQWGKNGVGAEVNQGTGVL